MSKGTRQFFALLVALFCIGQLITAQVTFSKGWGPGKRDAIYSNECEINAKSLALLVHSLMAEMKHLMACDRRTLVNYLQRFDH